MKKLNFEIQYNEKNQKLFILEPILENDTIFIIGGGYSLKNFDFNILKSKNVMSINKSIFNIPFADFLYFSDLRFYEWYKSDIDKLNCNKITVTHYLNDIVTMFNSGTIGLDFRNGNIRNGYNSGYAAINTAIHLGVKRIILLGYDMKNINNNSHFHNGYKDKTDNYIVSDGTFNKFKESYIGITKLLNNAGIEIYNCGENSDLPDVPKAKLEIFL